MLALLVLQTSALVLILRYSRSSSDGDLYFATTVVFFTEVLKYLLCLCLLAWQGGGLLPMARLYTKEVLSQPRETSLLAIPASLYVMQNNLLILALTNLDAATYQVTYQMKILTTAGFSVLLLGRQLYTRQWVSLLLLTAGVVLVQMPQMTGDSANIENDQDYILGFFSVVTACFSSGFAGVFYERLVKLSAQPSVIVRNLQLGIFSVIFSFGTMVVYNWRDILQYGLTHGYSRSVLAVIALQAFGGLVVAATIKYADNILKGFATSASIIVSSLASWLLIEDLSPGPTFLVGTCLVVVASLLYGIPMPTVLPSSDSLFNLRVRQRKFWNCRDFKDSRERRQTLLQV